MNKKPHNLIGKKFSKLMILKYSHTDNNYNHYWEVLCDCGKKKIVAGNNIVSKRTKSCGCLENPGSFKHGMTKTSIYGTWVGMKARCLNYSCKSYRDYGGRGITVCERWLNSFENFYKDMGDRPTLNHSIERRNNNEGYSPENCYWATPEEQMNNTRHNVSLTYQGITMNMAQWARKLGLSRACLWDRINKGLSTEKIFTEGKI